MHHGWGSASPSSAFSKIGACLWGVAGAIAPDAFTEKTIEVTETAEEAVVAKTGRVKEELVVRKDVDERVETVRDKVRREEVEVDPQPVI